LSLAMGGRERHLYSARPFAATGAAAKSAAKPFNRPPLTYGLRFI
jgi:hypothetical protein